MSRSRKLVLAVAVGLAGLLVLLVVAAATLAMAILPTLANGLCTGPGGAPTPGGQSTPGGPGWGTGPAPNGDQLSYAQLITSVVASRGLPQQAAVVAIATARQESALGQAGMNAAVDHDSLGLFQQRPSAGWGSPAQVKDPTYATNTFLDHLTTIAGWATMPVTKAAQLVQGSAFPSAYAQWETMARGLASRFWPGATTAPPPGAPPVAQQPAAQQAVAQQPVAQQPVAQQPATQQPAAQQAGAQQAGAQQAGAQQAGARPVAPGAISCPGDGGDGSAPAPGGVTPGGGTTAPPGLGAATGVGGAAVTTALAQLGKPYQWGGTGPAAFDCSGLTQAAWQKAGVTLPRTAAAQSRFGAPVASTAALQPGDLIFIAGSDGTAADPGHVGMYVGNGQLVHAPQQSEPVQLAPVSRWANQIVAMRRPSTTHPDAPSPAADQANPTNPVQAA